VYSALLFEVTGAHSGLKTEVKATMRKILNNLNAI
jgi:hypothetical protein